MVNVAWAGISKSFMCGDGGKDKHLIQTMGACDGSEVVAKSGLGSCLQCRLTGREVTGR